MIVPESPTGRHAYGYDAFPSVERTFYGSVSGLADGDAAHGRRIGFRIDPPQFAEDDPDDWYAAEVERMRERAPA